MKPFSEKLKNMLGDAAFQTAELPVEKIRFGEDIVAACASNACGRYGKFWTCPPGVGTLEELKAKYTKYRTAFVFTTKHELEDSFDFEGMMRGGKEHQCAESLIFDEVKAAGGALLGAGGGGCQNCAECTYPTAPCRFPERARPSVEACGISVVELARECGVNYHNGPNTVTYFSVVFFSEGE